MKRGKGASGLPVGRGKAAFVKIVEVEIGHVVRPPVAPQVLEMRIAADPRQRGAARRKPGPRPVEERRRPAEEREGALAHPRQLEGEDVRFAVAAAAIIESVAFMGPAGRRTRPELVVSRDMFTRDGFWANLIGRARKENGNGPESGGHARIGSYLCGCDPSWTVNTFARRSTAARHA